MADTTTLNESDVKNLTSAMNQFTKAITDSNKLLLKTKKSTTDVAKDINEIHSVTKKQETLSQKIANSTKDWGTEMKDVLKSATGFSKIFVGGSIAGFFANLVKDSINLNKEMTKLSVRMGQGKEGVKGLKNAVNDLQIETGASYESAVELVSTLSESKHIGNIKEAAEGISLFAKASGVAQGNAAQLTLSLSKGAGLSDKAINSMYAGMVKVQQSVGISKGGMEALTNSVQTAAVSMSAMGKSGDDIQKMTTNMTALVGSLEKVGISAAESTAMLDKLLDPDKIEDNIMLYSQLGISIEDALSGNVDLKGMDSQLKDMAQRIVDMGPIAGKQFAAQMGMTYKQATQMAKMDAGSADKIADAAKTSEEEALDTLKELKNNTLDIFSKAEEGVNKLGGMLRKLPILIMATAPFVINKVTKLIRGGFQNAFGEKQMSVATEGVGSAIATSAQKGLEKTQGLFKSAKNAITGNIAEWFDSTESGKFFNGVDKHIESLVNRANKVGFADKFFAAGLENVKNSYDELINGNIENQEKLTKAASDLGVTFDANKQNLADMKTVINENTNLTDKQREAALVVAEELDKQHRIQKGLEASKIKALKIDASVVEEQSRTQNKLKEAQAELEKVNSLEESRTRAAQELNDLERQLKGASSDVRKAYESQLKQKKEALKSANDAIVKELNVKNIAEANVILQKRVEKAIKAQKNATDEAVKAQENFNKAVQDGLKKQSGFGKLWSGITSNIKAAAATKFSNSTFGQAYNRAMGDAGPGASKGAAIGAGVKAVAGKGAAGLAKGLAKGLGGIMKSLGPMAIVMALIGKVLDKVKEPLETLIDNLLGFLEPVLKIIMDVLGPALTKIVKALLPPVLQVLAVILDVLRFILKPVQLILKALAHLPVVGKAFEGVSDVLDGLTSADTTKALRDAATNISNSGDDLTKAAKKQEEAAETQENKPQRLKAEGAKFIETQSSTKAEDKSVKEEKADSSAASTTTQTKEQKSDEQKIKEQTKEKREKENNEYIEDIKETGETLKAVLQSIFTLLSDTLGGTDNSFNWTAESKNRVSLDQKLEEH